MKKLFILAPILIGTCLFFLFACESRAEKNKVDDLWTGYKKLFISDDGKVSRPRQNDVVSEGQAYAMFRAALMNDKKTFDQCYVWTEKNLSRKKISSDNLLAWNWKEGEVLDWMPASDADIDYALSLIMAFQKWGKQHPEEFDSYEIKSHKILTDILEKMTFRTSSGRLYLLPWILDSKTNSMVYPVNPSYYSPGHFKIFHQFTNDPRWLELYDTTYFILFSLMKKFDENQGIGLIPDWCQVNTQNDNFIILDGKNSGFGWESIRIPFRVYLDYLWFDSPQAKTFLKGTFSQFIEEEWIRDQKIFCEYTYNGTPIKKYENPLFYSMYYIPLKFNNSPYKNEILNKSRSYLKRTEDGDLYYLNEKEYFVNSLSWMAEIIANQSTEGMLKFEKKY